MMKFAILAMALASASAFAPSNLQTSSVQRTSSRTSPMMADMSPSIPFLLKPKYYPSKMVGDVGFDPLGLSDFFDMKFLREAEIKHGRVAMLAIVGLIVPEFWHIPGDLYNNPAPLEAFDQVGPKVWGQIIFFSGMIEGNVYGWDNMQYMNMFDDKTREPGNIGFDPLKLMEEGDPNEYALKEITHCRLAMLAVSGMITQCGITGTGLYGGHL